MAVPVYHILIRLSFKDRSSTKSLLTVCHFNMEAADGKVGSMS